MRSIRGAMHHNTLAKCLLPLAAMMALACGGGGGGSSSTEDSSSDTQSGLVIDWLIKDAFVFADLDGDESHDENEPSDISDENGAYTLTGLPANGDFTLIAKGGTDTATGNIFEYVLKAPKGYQNITPISSLIVDSDDDNSTLAEKEQSVRELLDLEAGTTLDQDITSNEHKSLYGAGQKVMAMLKHTIDPVVDVTDSDNTTTFKQNLSVTTMASIARLLRDKRNEQNSDANTTEITLDDAFMGNIIEDAITTALEGSDDQALVQELVAEVKEGAPSRIRNTITSMEETLAEGDLTIDLGKRAQDVVDDTSNRVQISTTERIAIRTEVIEEATEAQKESDNTAPTFTSSALSVVEENQERAIQLVASDNLNVTYSVEGDGSERVRVNPFTGQVHFRELPDFETLNQVTFTAVATDEAGNETRQNITVNITDGYDVKTTRDNAFKMLTMSSFGPTEAMVQDVLRHEGGIEGWIDTQLSKPSAYTSPDDAWPTHLERTKAIAKAFYSEEDYNTHFPGGELAFNEQTALGDVAHFQMSAWMDHALGNPLHPELGSDQLRQRVAYALSQILVTSDSFFVLARRGETLAHYVDILAKNALGNYEVLLREVSRSPAMGAYLSHAYNVKANKTRKTRPDENYARELMQLFSLGLFELDENGEVVKDDNDNAVPSYTQSDVEELAKVMTGWYFPNTEERFLSETRFQLRFRDGAMDQLMIFSDEKHETEADLFYDTDNDGVSDGDGNITLLGQTVSLTAQDEMLDGSGNTTNSGLDAALKVLFNHNNVPFFVSEKLIKHLVSSNPSKAYVRRVAKIFKNNGHGVRGDLGAVVKAILMDDEAYFNRKEKAKEPLIAFTQMARVLQARPFSTADDHWAYRSDDTWGKGGIENRKKDKVFTDAYWLPNIKSSLGYAPMRSPSVFNFFKANFEPVVGDKDLPYSGNTHLNSQVFPELDPQTDQFFAKFSNALAHLLFQREVVGLQDEYLSRINDDLDDQNTTASSRRPNTYHANGLLVNISEPLKAMEMALENDDNLDFSTLKEASAEGEITPKQKAMEGLYDWMERHLVGAPIAREFRDIVTTFVVKSATIHNLNNKSLAMAMVNEACIAVATSPLFMIQR